MYLVCSDGLSDGLWDHEIRRILTAVRRPAEVRPAVCQLVAGAKQTSGRDNITAVVALVEGPPSAGAPPGFAGLAAPTSPWLIPGRPTN